MPTVTYIEADGREHIVTVKSGTSARDAAARLRRENGQLRMERDILKKAALIFGAASR
jgi:transposase-like protein